MNGYPFYETADGQKQFGVFSHIPCGNRDGTYRYNHDDSYNNTGYYYWAFNYNRRGRGSDYQWDRDHSSSSGGWNYDDSSSSAGEGTEDSEDSSSDSHHGYGHRSWRNRGKKLFYNNPAVNGTLDTLPGDMPDWDCVTNHGSNFKNGQRHGGEYSIDSLIGCYHSCTNTNTNIPTTNPTDKPTNSPSDKPTDSPTDPPTEKPSSSPTEKPSLSPSSKPSDAPTDQPSEKPTTSPIDEPTPSPTPNPTPPPTDKPTQSPSNRPTSSPTENPTDKPTASPIDDDVNRECNVTVTLDVYIEDLEARDVVTVEGTGSSDMLTGDKGASLYYDESLGYVMLTFLYYGEFGVLNGSQFRGCYGGQTDTINSCFSIRNNSVTMIDVINLVDTGEFTYWIGECSACGDLSLLLRIDIVYDTDCTIVIDTDTMPVISGGNSRTHVGSSWVWYMLTVMLGSIVKIMMEFV